MGYIEETGAAQHFRDARITPIYEGTTAIQANDLINRKILRDQGETLRGVLAQANALAQDIVGSSDPALSAIGAALAAGVADATRSLDWLLTAGAQDPRLPAAASVPMLFLLGVVLGGYQMARAAIIARQRLDAGSGEDSFYDAKLKTAWHYSEHVLTQASGWAARVTRGSQTVMSLTHDQL